ncbi:MAG: CPBP family intramembrane metalloprotease [Planctomycetes bacterium]|nr:CPBP family intramembrane metalloprotease [Planctomycetota bacterium]
MSAGTARCPACRRPVPADARFCRACGKALDASSAGRDRAAVQATALVFGGVLGAGLLLAPFAPDAYASAGQELRWTALFFALLVAFAAAALARLGRPAWRASLAQPPRLPGLGLGLLGGAACVLVSFGYVGLLSALAPEGETEALPPGSLALTLLSMVALPAVIEEWTDRGVLWVALRELAGPVGTVVASALLFGLSHAWNGGGLFEVPHRFVCGLVLGALRERTGSLAPSIVAHATLNAVAVLW